METGVKFLSLKCWEEGTSQIALRVSHHFYNMMADGHKCMHATCLIKCEKHYSHTVSQTGSNCEMPIDIFVCGSNWKIAMQCRFLRHS